MGGRGTYASGNNVPFTYRTTGKISGIKVVAKIDTSKSGDLPLESHTSDAYISLYPDGTFHQCRFYNKDHTANYDIDYHWKNINGKREMVYHIHVWKKGEREKIGRVLTAAEIKKYNKIIGGKYEGI